MPVLATALTSLKTMIDGAKIALDISKKFSALEYKQMINQMFDQMMDLKMKLVDAEEQIGAKESTVYLNGVYWKRGEEHQGDPYCPKCLDADHQLIRMQSTMNWQISDFVAFAWRCHNCSLTIDKPDQPTPPGNDGATVIRW